MTSNDGLRPMPERVDALLSAWAASQRLDRQAAADIRAAILADPHAHAPATTGLDAQWWLELAGHTNGVIARSMRRQPFPTMPRLSPLAA
jgi:hypothetical protein